MMTSQLSARQARCVMATISNDAHWCRRLSQERPRVDLVGEVYVPLLVGWEDHALWSRVVTSVCFYISFHILYLSKIH